MVAEGATLNGGRLLARALRIHGVEYLFSLSSDLLNPLYDACLDEGLRIIDCRHEQSAVHMADGWARATGNPGVAAVTGGPGVTNALTGLANAFRCGSPILVIAGRRPLAEAQRGSLAELDAMPLVSPVTKWAGTVAEASRIPEYVATALGHARSGRPGPAFLEVPADLLAAEAEVGQMDASSPSPPAGDPQAIERAAHFL